jgi:hypothetical protein
MAPLLKAAFLMKERRFEFMREKHGDLSGVVIILLMVHSGSFAGASDRVSSMLACAGFRIFCQRPATQCLNERHPV